jgi:hypothetical protein
MIELTEPQLKLLDAEGQPPHVVDPRTNKTFVLVPEDWYQRVLGLLDPGPLTQAERQAILQNVWRRAGWDDPRMDEYDSL